MSWKRGFIRAWIVLSSAWVLMVGAFTYSSIVTPFLPQQAIFLPGLPPGFVLDDGPWSKYQDGEARGGLRVAERSSWTYRQLELAEAAGELQAISVTGLEGVKFFFPAQMPPDAISSELEDSRQKVAALRNAMVRRRRSDALQSAAWIGLAPPLGLLALGVAIGWVASGFSAKKDRQGL